MTQTIRKFPFDTEFAADGTVLRAASPAARRYTQEEVDAEKKAAFAQGRDEAIAQAERTVAAALQTLAQHGGTAVQKIEAELAQIKRDAAVLAITAARKIAGAALAAHGEERALQAIEETMDMLRHGPRLLVRAEPALADRIKERIDALCDEHRYPGAVLVRPDPAIKGGAVSIDWTEGVITIDPADIETRIAALIDAADGAQT